MATCSSPIRTAMPLSLLLFLCLGQHAGAHALGVECKLKGTKITVEAFFDDDTPARDAKVTVADAKKQTVSTGRTDANGNWTVDSPGPGKYRVTVDAGDGHLASANIVVPGAASSATTTTTISDSPSRSAFTRIPWFAVLVGISVIFGGAAVYYAVRRTFRRAEGQFGGSR